MEPFRSNRSSVVGQLTCGPEINNLQDFLNRAFCYALNPCSTCCGGILIRLFRPRGILLIENLALRQQLAVFKRQHSRPRLAVGDKLLSLAFPEDSAHPSVARHRGALASCRLPVILGVRFPGR
jgi:hypothetical protein